MQTVREIMTDKVNGCTFLGLDTETVVTLTGGKKNPQQGRVTKVTIRSNVMVFSNKNSNAYDNMVKRRLIQEGKDPDGFVLSPRKWGVRESGTPFVTHNGNEYLEVIFLKAGESHYRLDGKVIPREQIQGLPERKEEGEQGGLDNKVIIRTFAVESILAITVDKTTHIVSERAVAMQQVA
jgi:hypothetical protein